MHNESLKTIMMYNINDKLLLEFEDETSQLGIVKGFAYSDKGSLFVIVDYVIYHDGTPYTKYIDPNTFPGGIINLSRN
jgi:hypothetical protein